MIIYHKRTYRKDIILSKLKSPFTILIIAIIAVSLTAMGIIIYKTNEKEKNSASDALTDKDTPSAFSPKIVESENDKDRINADGTTITVGDPDASTTVTIYEDFSCPACKATEAELRTPIHEYVKNDDVNIQYKAMSILDNTDEYSTRAANFSLTIAQVAPEKWGTIHDTLFENQPPHTNEPTGYTDEQFIALAEEVGVGDMDEVKKSVKEQPYAQQISDDTDSAIKSGVKGTPTVHLDGEEISYSDASQFVSIVDAKKEK